MRTGWMALGTWSLAGAVLAQAQAGPEFRVNSYTPYTQRHPAVAHDGRGHFVVVWESYGADGHSSGVSAQRFEPGGAPLGGELVVNVTTTNAQEQPAVAAARDGSFVVAWTGADGDGGGIYARWFDRDGLARTGEVRVNSYTTSWQMLPTAAMDPDGDTVVVWQSANQDGSGMGVFGQRFGRHGTRQGGEFRVNTYTTFEQSGQSVASDSAGNFVVVWNGGPANAATGQRFDASGARIGAEFAVNSSLVGAAIGPSVAMHPAGGFVVAWTHHYSVTSDIRARRFDAGGAPLGGDFVVNTYTTGRQRYAALDVDDAGTFVVTWSSEGQDGDAYGVFAQRFRPSGAPEGAEFRVNATTAGSQTAYRMGLGADRNGNFAVVWAGRSAPNVDEVFGQRFGGLHPAFVLADPAPGLPPDSDGNGVFEPGEGAWVRTAWSNSATVHRFVDGAATEFVVPGTTAVMTTTLATYDLPPGATATCVTTVPLRCFAASVAAPPGRPSTHWDGSFREELTTGHSQTWVLHLGDSFGDIPRTSPFYRFVETLLHSGVTSGCTGTAFCPLTAASREQMAVFVLVAKERAGYTPPACTAPPFADVPASSPFCPWIEELARRGVVAGCGGGNYCPTGSVSREQMAVFVLRTKEPGVTPPPCGTPMFADVPASSPFCPWIEELARRGVVAGCGGGNYCPAAAVTREQMAVFIAVTFALQLYGP